MAFVFAICARVSVNIGAKSVHVGELHCNPRSKRGKGSNLLAVMKAFDVIVLLWSTALTVFVARIRGIDDVAGEEILPVRVTLRRTLVSGGVCECGWVRVSRRAGGESGAT